MSAKTLFIDVNVSNSHFTLDPIWAGLVDRLGCDNVIDFPTASKRREGIPRRIGDPEKDWGAERRSMCYTRVHDRLRNVDLVSVNSMLRAGEIERIYVDERDASFDMYMRTVARFSDVPVVVIAGLDRFDNVSPEHVRMMYGRNLEKMFVDNWHHEYDLLPYAHPMNYSTNFDHLWDVGHRDRMLAEKKYDICFVGYNSHPDRARFVDHINSKWSHLDNLIILERSANSFGKFILKDEYFRQIAQSKICLNLRGAAESGKALRFYEIPYVGSYMLSQKFGGTQLYPFGDGVHCDYFSDEKELDEKIVWALVNHEAREKIAARGHEHAMMFHTARARVDMIYEVLNGQKGPRTLE